MAKNIFYMKKHELPRFCKKKKHICNPEDLGMKKFTSVWFDRKKGKLYTVILLYNLTPFLTFFCVRIVVDVLPTHFRFFSIFCRVCKIDNFPVHECISLLSI